MIWSYQRCVKGTYKTSTDNGCPYRYSSNYKGNTRKILSWNPISEVKSFEALRRLP